MGPVCDPDHWFIPKDWVKGAWMAQRNIKVVKLLEPELCLECRFAKTATVELADGTFQKMIHCKRLDCDNWDYQTAEEAKSIQPEDKAA